MKRLAAAFALVLLSTLPPSLLGHHGTHQVPVLYRGVATGGGGMYMESLYLPPVTTGPWAPAWSPDGKSIAFAMLGTLWAVPVEGGNAVQITSGPHYDSEPSWSPLGNQLAFARDTGEGVEIWIVDADGSGERQLTNSFSFSLNPEWSPDGQSLLFVTMLESRDLVLHSIPAGGGEATPVLADGNRNITPSWSPDGQSIVLVSNRRWNGRRIQGTGGIWVHKLGDPEPTILVPEETVWHAYPAWSPDGTKIAFGSFRTGENQLFVIPSGGGNPLRLTFVGGEIYGPTWSPDSKQLAFISNAESQFRLYTIPVYGGTPREVAVNDLQYRNPVGRLRVTVQDDSTGMPTAARVYLKGSDGKGYAPRGEFHRMVVVTNDHYFQSDGSFEVDLPVGTASIDATRGFEYQPLSQQVEITAGQTRELQLTFERHIDLPAMGWHSGDNHIHMNYGGIFQATPRTLMNEANAEDLHVINALAANQSGTRIHDLSYFQGKLNDVSQNDRKLYISEEYRPSFAGHLSLLNLKEFFFPQFDGMAGTAVAAHYPSNSQVLDSIHEQGGLGGYVHPYLSQPEDNRYSGAREFPVNVALGNVDFFDLLCIWSEEDIGESVWYRTLNLGFRVPASAGSDAMTDYWRHPAIGSVRVYVKSGRPLDYGNWLRAFTQGKSFVTSGPLLFLKVDGREPGDELRLPGNRETSVHVEIDATSVFPMERVDVILNGKVVHSAQPVDPSRSSVQVDVPVTQSGWIAARVRGPARERYVMDTYVYAHTNPVYLIKGGQPVSSSEDAVYFLAWIDAVIEMIEQSTFDTAEQKLKVLKFWRKARRIYADLAE